ncbi:sodium:proton antiporter NhaD [Thiorhodovibrio frisius]|uniref:Na+/H+ antiporter NhaD-like permease n=1 Tax=Thiorhodovibrio frisius TaxID=631362 RepID=H8Z6E8_9GAMM|nr:sodium:proton antiporter NhaD [Thiorhodovibrio frisius]EIC20732.1 Na+/H+ antiporter NhaD-like permease [Thiorhodovibrio frisius]WPL21480.1 Na+/H+ antiporter, NhaD family [Thiorhodovibrio frisius]
MHDLRNRPLRSLPALPSIVIGRTTLGISTALLGTLLLLFSGSLLASEGGAAHLNLTTTWVGFTSLLIFVVAYGLVMTEEFTHLRKSKPVMLAAGAIWLLIAYYYSTHHGSPHAAAEAVRHNIMEFGELFLFLLAAMTYINTMEERLVFDALRSWLLRMGFGYRTLFWMTGFLAFFISPVADNLTTALLMCAVVMAVGADSPKFVGLACINIVIAANAGGAFSPFGDITTLMVWQKGLLHFETFFRLFIPSLVSFAVPAWFMHKEIPDIKPPPSNERVRMKRGAIRVVLLFIATIGTAVSFHNYYHLPPVLGMMTGLAYLSFFSYYLNMTGEMSTVRAGNIEDSMPFNIFNKVARAEWDTLMFFYGVILCVGALGFIGYLELVSHVAYDGMGPTIANTLIGILSAIVDNIPVMFAVLTMNPDMSQGQWLLVTLTAGVGGSLLSIGSAAGVALMGQSKGMYTFFGHLKWMPYIAAGYFASILCHFIINFGTFKLPAGLVSATTG